MLKLRFFLLMCRYFWIGLALLHCITYTTAWSTTVDSAYSGHLGTGLKWPQLPMALISGGILVLMWILGHDFSGHNNRLALISDPV